MAKRRKALAEQLYCRAEGVMQSLTTALRVLVPAKNEFIPELTQQTAQMLWNIYGLSSRATEPQLSEVDDVYLDMLANTSFESNMVVSGDSDIDEIREKLLPDMCTMLVSDLIVNDYVRILDRIYGTDSLFFLQPRGFSTELEKDYSGVRRHLRVSTRIEEWLQRRTERGVRAFIPMHRWNHWIFLEFQDNRVYVYDSLVADIASYQLSKTFHLLFADDLFINNVAKWTFALKPGVPKQLSGIECGVAVLLNMRSIALKESFVEAAQINNYRRVIALEILFSRIPYAFVGKKP